jgi:hypothetical protein
LPLTFMQKLMHPLRPASWPQESGVTSYHVLHSCRLA